MIRKIEQAVKTVLSDIVLLVVMFDTMKQIIRRLFDNDDAAKNIER